MGEIVFFLELTRTSILDDVDLLTESPIAPPRPRSVYFDVVVEAGRPGFDAVEAGRPGFDADSFRQGLQEALVQDPDLLALGRKQGGFNDHAGFVGVGVEVAVAAAPAAAYRVRIDFKPDGWIDRDVVDAIIADNVKAELTLS
jgi:hypothetical protein